MRKSKTGCKSPLYVDWHQGSRDYQEDYFGVYSQNNRTLMVVTDGMGGHSSGDLASRWVVEELIEAFKKDPSIDQFIGNGIKQALARMNDSGKDMGCTMVLGLLEKEVDRFKFSYTWIGDSRIYLEGGSGKPTDNAKAIDQKYDKTLWLLTDDDSFVWGFLLNNELTIDQLTQHPNKNQLEYSIHPRQEHIDEILCKRIRSCYIEENDRVLLCTDGIWESYLTQSEILDHLNDANPKKAIGDHLKKALKEERFNDNGTYILAGIGQQILDQQCLPGKKRSKFFGSLFFGVLALLLFTAIFFVLIGKFNTLMVSPPEQPVSIISPEANPGQKSGQGQPAVKTEGRHTFYVIQVGSFPNFEEAKYYSERFRRMGYPVEISSPHPVDSSPLFHVSIGHFDSLNAAEAKMRELEKEENIKFVIKMRY